jgi:H/ACA ribonucleoprotein complex subunit 4
MGAAEEAEYSIKPENVTPAIPTSEWPLLLKNYDKCMETMTGV